MLIQKIRKLPAKKAAELRKDVLPSFGAVGSRNIEAIRLGNDKFLGLGATEPYFTSFVGGWIELNT